MRRRLAAVLAFIRLGRPVFLVGGFVMFGLGAAVARVAEHVPIDPRRYLLGQAVVIAFQLMTHYANDYFDYDADRANRTPTRWSGGSRVLAAGELPRDVAFIAAVIFAGLGVVATAAIAIDHATAPAAIPIITAIFLVSWEYSAPPLRLCATGVGELATAVVVTGLVPLLGYVLQAAVHDHLRLMFVAVAPLACLQVAMLLAIELPDAAGDLAAGKRTLVIRLGAVRARGLVIGLVAAAFALLPIGWWLGLPARVAIAGALAAPIAIWQIARVHRGYADPTRWEGIAFRSVALLVGVAVAELAALVTLPR